MAGSWLPDAEGPFVLWFINWVNKLTNTYNGTFNLTLPDTSSLAADLAALNYDVGLSSIFKAKTKDVNEHKHKLIHGPTPLGPFPVNPTLGAPPTLVAANIIARIDIMVARIKAHLNYTTEIGQDLGIEPIPGAPPTNQLEIEAFARPNSEGEVGFNLGGSDGAWIEGSVDDGPWVHLANDRHSPYIDNRPPAVAGRSEVRKYRARPLDGDDPYGDWSNIAQLSTIP